MWFFSSKKTSSIAVIDIQSSSVGAAYVYFSKENIRTICYATRVEFDPRENEESEVTLERALSTALEQLTKEGSPELHRATGSGSVGRVIVSVSTPWQETTIQTHTITYPKPRTITKVMLEIAAKEKRELKEGTELIDEMILSVFLNGYEIPMPYGKEASRIEFTMLASFLPKVLHEAIHAQVRKTFHMNETSLVSFAPVAFVALRETYPFEKDFLILSVSDRVTDAAQCRASVLVAAGSVPHGVCNLLEAGRIAEKTTLRSEEVDTLETENVTSLSNQTRNTIFSSQPRKLQDEWVESIRIMLEGFSRTIFLPKTVFLVAESGVRDYIARVLGNSEARKLWLSDAGPTIISLTPEIFSKSIKFENVQLDITLAMIALYDEKRFAPVIAD